MNKLLGKALKELAKLPDSEQEALAKWLLAELESERRWDRAYAETEEELAKLADEALAEYRQGGTEDLAPNQL